MTPRTSMRVSAIIAPIAVLASFGSADARTFGGYDCIDDCSGHAAGYRWAEEKGIDDEALCPPGNSVSFHEGCRAYVEDPTRGADEDDDGELID